MRWTRPRLTPALLPFAIPAVLVSFGLFLLPMAFVASHAATEQKSLWDAIRGLAGSALVGRVFLNTVEISLLAAAVTVLLAFPVALHIFRQERVWKTVFLTLILIPFWTSILVKSYSFMIILGDHGIINTLLHGGFGLDPLPMLFNRFAVIVGMSNFLVPFAVFPILASLAAQNRTVQSAAGLMGASPFRVFWSITFPQTLPGLLAAALMCLVISMGFFVTPALLGGRGDMMMANVIDLYTREILDWQSASLIALLLLAFCGAVSSAVLRLQARFGN